jgi:hypothetical protein
MSIEILNYIKSKFFCAVPGKHPVSQVVSEGKKRRLSKIRRWILMWILIDKRCHFV